MELLFESNCADIVVVAVVILVNVDNVAAVIVDSKVDESVVLIGE